MNGLYDKLKAKGHDLSWYEKRQKQKNKNPDGSIALNDDRCCLLSIYLLDQGGKLHTTNSNGEPYMVIRSISTKPKENIYLCAHCQIKFKTYEQATAHYKQEETNE